MKILPIELFLHSFARVNFQFSQDLFRLQCTTDNMHAAVDKMDPMTVKANEYDKDTLVASEFTFVPNTMKPIMENKTTNKNTILLYIIIPGKRININSVCGLVIIYCKECYLMIQELR